MLYYLLLFVCFKDLPSAPAGAGMQLYLPQREGSKWPKSLGRQAQDWRY